MRILHEFEVELKGESKVTLGFKRPSRMDIQEIDMVYSSYQSDCIKRGIITKDMLVKSYKDFGGYLSEQEVKQYTDTYEEFLSKQKQLADLKDGSEDSQELVKEIIKLYNDIQDFEMQEQDLFSKTAEVIARNRTILWIVLSFIYEKDGDNWKPIFAGGNDEAKFESYEKLEDEDPFKLDAIISRSSLFVSFWFTGRATTSEDFKAVEDMLNNDFGDVEVLAPEEEEEVEEKPKKKTAKKKTAKPRRKKAAVDESAV